MALRTEEEWQQLLALQPASGLSVTAFCREHQISTNSFYKRVSRPKLHEAINDFIKVTPIVETYDQRVELPIPILSEAISLQTPVGTFSFPCSLPASYMATLIRELHSC